MREIIFRGMDLNNKWIYGGYCKDVTKKGEIVYIINKDDDDFYPVSHESVGQYINREDLNGRQIFEKDIVKAHYFYQGVGENLGVTEEDGEIIGEVFIDSLYGCGIRNKKQTLFFSETSDEEEPCIEIIGNKWEDEKE